MHPLARVSLFAAALLLVGAAPALRSPASESARPPLSLADAEILAYLSPFAASQRRVGMDVRIVAGDGPCFQRGFVGVDLISTRPFPRGGVEDHEYVAVNLFTGQVYNPIPIPAVELSTRQLLGVAAIMRKTHGVSQAVFEKYRRIDPEIKGPPPCANY